MNEGPHNFRVHLFANDLVISPSNPHVLADILSLAQDGSKFTKLILGANLSTDNAKKYITRVQNRGLLKYDVLTATYTVTGMGGMFLEVYDQMVEQASVLRIIQEDNVTAQARPIPT